MVFKICEGISCSSFYVKEFDVIDHKTYFFLYNHIEVLAILYLKSLANLVVEVGTMHSQQILFATLSIKLGFICEGQAWWVCYMMVKIIVGEYMDKFKWCEILQSFEPWSCFVNSQMHSWWENCTVGYTSLLCNKIWWLCLVPTATTRFASEVGYRMAKI